jgi:uncharacterized membrane protein
MKLWKRVVISGIIGGAIGFIGVKLGLPLLIIGLISLLQGIYWGLYVEKE